jgi:hypothetical protein
MAFEFFTGIFGAAQPNILLLFLFSWQVSKMYASVRNLSR